MGGNFEKKLKLFNRANIVLCNVSPNEYQFKRTLVQSIIRPTGMTPISLVCVNLRKKFFTFSKKHYVIAYISSAGFLVTCGCGNQRTATILASHLNFGNFLKNDFWTFLFNIQSQTSSRSDRLLACPSRSTRPRNWLNLI